MGPMDLFSGLASSFSDSLWRRCTGFETAQNGVMRIRVSAPTAADHEEIERLRSERFPSAYSLELAPATPTEEG